MEQNNENNQKYFKESRSEGQQEKIKTNYYKKNTSVEKGKTSSHVKYLPVNGSDKKRLEQLLVFDHDVATNHLFFYETEESQPGLTRVARWGVTLKQLPLNEHGIVTNGQQHVLKCSWNFWAEKKILTLASKSRSKIWKNVNAENTLEIEKMFVEYLNKKSIYDL